MDLPSGLTVELIIILDSHEMSFFLFSRIQVLFSPFAYFLSENARTTVDFFPPLYA